MVKIIGYLLVVTPILLLFIAQGIDQGFDLALLTWGLAILFAACFIKGIDLIQEG